MLIQTFADQKRALPGAPPNKKERQSLSLFSFL